jgi:hypothetical protein
MLVLRFSKLYPIASGADLRPGTIALYFSVGGTVVITQGSDTTSVVGVAGSTVETGVIDSITSITAATVLGCLGR